MIAGAVLIVAIARATWVFGWTIWAEAIFPSYGYGDPAIFMAMGRALLNGLTPYVDLFETKPPAIFFVTALSLWYDGDITLARMSQTLVLFLIPLTIVTPVFLTRERFKEHRFMVLGIALLFGMILGKFTSDIAGRLYSESFGVLFALVFVVTLAVKRERVRSISTTVFLCIGIGGAIAFKEAFLFSCLACALCYCEDGRSLWHGFGKPLVIAAIVGMVILGITGMLVPYLTEYLPYMLLEHGAYNLKTHSGSALPLWQSGFAVHRMLGFLWSANKWLMILIIFLWAGFGAKENSHSPIRRVVRLLLIVFFAVFSAQVGGSSGHQQAVAIPVFGALFLSLLPTLVHSKGTAIRIIGVCIFAALIVTPFAFHTNAEGWLAKEREKERVIKTTAATIDTVLERCGVDRYLAMSVTDQFYAYTRHSPLSTGLLAEAINRKKSVPIFRTAMTKSFQEAQILVAKQDDEVSVEIAEYLVDKFTPKPPPCAGSYELPEHLAFAFRKETIWPTPSDL